MVCGSWFSPYFPGSIWGRMEAGRKHWWAEVRYENEDGGCAASGWYWLDGNRDGTAECYYFDQEGWMAPDTVTPDGYQVNADRAWWRTIL